MTDIPEKPEDAQVSADETAAAGAVEKLSLWGYFVMCLKNYAVFSGRARRREFWGFHLFYLISMVLLVHLVKIPLASMLCWLALILPRAAVFVRRMHDIDKSWRYILIPLAAIIIIMGIAAFFLGNAGDAAYGMPLHILLLLTFCFPVSWIVFFAPMFFVIVLLCINSQPGTNRYGPNPKGREEE